MVIGKNLATHGLREKFRSGHENSCLGFGGIVKDGEGLEVVRKLYLIYWYLYSDYIFILHNFIRTTMQ